MQSLEAVQLDLVQPLRGVPAEVRRLEQGLELEKCRLKVLLVEVRAPALLESARLVEGVDLEVAEEWLEKPLVLEGRQVARNHRLEAADEEENLAHRVDVLLLAHDEELHLEVLLERARDVLEQEVLHEIQVVGALHEDEPEVDALDVVAEELELLVVRVLDLGAR